MGSFGRSEGEKRWCLSPGLSKLAKISSARPPKHQDHPPRPLFQTSLSIFPLRHFPPKIKSTVIV